jgi:hypothetical protein
MGFSHRARTVLGCEIDHKLIDPAKLKANWKQNDNLEDDDDANSIGSCYGEVLELAQTFISKNFKNLCIKFSNVYDSDESWEAWLSFKIGDTIKDLQKDLNYASSSEGVKQFKEAMIALGQKKKYKITLYSLPTCS